MKRITCILLHVFLAFVSEAQNLVPNGSFENYSTCPTGYSQVANCTGWRQYTGGTSDFFHTCAISTSVFVPSNGMGYQMPAHGNAYGGLIDYQFTLAYKEYLANVISPMTIGLIYEVSMSVSLSNYSEYTINDLGIWFYDNGPTSILSFAPLTVTPQVSFTSFGAVTDTANWVRLRVLFTPDSAYDNIVIGGFGSATASTTGFGVGFNKTYYYIDSVVIKLSSGITNNYMDSIVCIGDTFNVPYLVNGNVAYSSGNIFRVQLSNSSGSFNSGTTIIGTRTSNASGNIQCVIPTGTTISNNYRLRILSTNLPDTSYHNQYSIRLNNIRATLSSSNNGPICSGDTLRLFASSTSSGVNYAWTGPNGFSSFAQNPSIINASSLAAGSYYAFVNLNGCVSKDTTTVIINPSPTTITATTTTPICERDTLRLYSTNSSSGVTWAWAGPGSYTSTVQNPVRLNSLPSMSGDYIVTATNNFGCTSKDTITVLVKPLPLSVAATVNTICEGSTLFLTGNTTSSGVIWSWVGPNSFSSTLQNPNISSATTAASGAYILTATLNDCIDKDTAYGTVFPIPATPVPSANTPVCVGQDLKLTATNVAGATYSWTSTIGYSSTLQNPIRTGAATAMAGKYYVRATVNGCSSGVDSVTVAVNAAPVINMYPSPKDSICQGATLTLISSQSNAGSSFQRTWYRNNNPVTGATGANYLTTSAADSDVYYVTLTGGNCAEPVTDTSANFLIRVFPWLPASVSITATPTGTVVKGTMINFTAKPVNGGNSPTYQWTRNGSNIIGALSNIWGANTLNNNDDICVNMSSSYFCPNPKTAKSNCIRVSIETTGIKGTWAGKQPSIYPNPVKDLLIIEGITTGTTIQLHDVTGRTLIRKIAIGNNEPINTQSLIPGNYILLLDDSKGGNIRVKITKE